MGLFGVNIPPLYGEGEHAFFRLQLQISSNNDDESIFAWTSAPNDDMTGRLLAESPALFANCGNVVKIYHGMPKILFAMTNLGLRLAAVVIPLAADVENGNAVSPQEYLLPLSCGRIHGRTKQSLAIQLKRELFDTWFRRATEQLTSLDPRHLDSAKREPRVMYVKQRPVLHSVFAFTLNLDSLRSHGFTIYQRTYQPPDTQVTRRG